MESAKLGLLRNAMNAYARRRQALSNNIANLDTPGYDRMSVSFEEELRSARRHSDGLQQAADVEPRMEGTDTRPSLEDELMELSDTQMRTRLATRALSEHFDLMSLGITGDRR